MTTALSPDTAYRVLAATPLAAQAKRRRPAIEAGEYAPRFTLTLARKDARLINEAAAAAGADLRLMAAGRPGWPAGRPAAAGPDAERCAARQLW